VAYVVYSPEPRFYTEIYTMNPDGSDQRQITSDGGDFLGKVDVGIENPIDMYSSNSQPRWSPDGSQLAFLAKVALDQDEVRVVDAHGSNMRVLFDDWEGSMFSWSPDGTQIAYTTEEGVRIANADGSSSELLLATSPIAIGPAGPTTATFSARWSADGRWIAFIEATGEGYVAGVEFVTIADLATGSVARGICVEQRNQAIDWHPTEPRLLVSDCGGNGGIVGTDGALLAELPFSGYSPTWSPSGTEILYNAAQPWGEHGALWYYEVATKTSHPLQESFGGASMDWQPDAGP
jgi:Tol biopolymer transport system component